MKTGKQDNQTKRAAALASAKRWLAARASKPRQCDCEQCRMVLARQAVRNVIDSRDGEGQRTLFDALGA